MSRALVALAILAWPLRAPLAGQADPPLGVDPDPILTIGGDVAASPEYAFTHIASVAVVGDSILVLDSEACEIRIFDHRGMFLGRVGRAGEGPGEFAWPTEMRLVPEGVAVVDLKLRRATVFTLAGELLRTRQLGRLADRPLAGSAPLRGDLEVTETSIAIGSDIGAFPERLLLLTHGSEPGVDTLARYATGYVPYTAAGSFGFLSARSGSEGDWTTLGDSVLAAVSGEPPTLLWWRASEGGLLAPGKVTLPVRPEPLTPADVRDLVARTNEDSRAEGYEPIPRSARTEPPSYWGQIGGLVLSPAWEGWIQWARPRSAGDDTWFRVDLRTGGVRATRLPVGFRLLAAASGALYGVVTSAYDVPVVTVLRMREGGP